MLGLYIIPKPWSGVFGHRL